MSESKGDFGQFTAYTIILLLLLSVCTGKCSKDGGGEVVRTDTLTVVVRDTIRIEQPTEVVRYVLRHDTIRSSDIVVVRDTLTDSVSVVVPITQAVYSDSTEKAVYTAYVSGYRAALDSIDFQIMSTEKIITITEREKASRWGLGVQLGVGVSPNGLAAPYIGVGVQYNLFRK